VRALGRGIRLVGLLAACVALGGCATILPFQTRDEALVRVADRAAVYPARQVARTFVDYAQLAALAYDDVRHGARYQGWEFVRTPDFVCPPGRICAGELGVQLWVLRSGGACAEAVIAFRGTIFSSADDWFANLHWLHRLTPLADYYEQARLHIGTLVAVAERMGCSHRIIAIGHSLGGGLAQHVAYAHPRIRVVYAFDPSFVIGSTDFGLLGLPIHSEGRLFDYVYEHGEVLAFLRFIGRLFHPYPGCNPRVRTVRFNTISGSIFSQHRIVALAANLRELARSAATKVASSNPAVPVRTNFRKNEDCPRV
jgi:pimeloyl-ACP methyl ester carboxylesterase